MPRREIGSAGLKNQVLKYCRSRGGWWRAIPASPWGNAGLPDIIGCYRGYFIGIEVKHPNGQGKIRRAQELTLHQIFEADGLGVIVDSLDQVVNLLNNVDENA
jgi:hypothetical protein